MCLDMYVKQPAACIVRRNWAHVIVCVNVCMWRGQIHESYGVEVADGTTFINAACVTVRYKPASARPVVFDVTPKAS